MFVLFVVGAIFCLFGGLFLLVNLYFKNHGKVLRGSVIGIERYISKGRKRSRSVMYRPLIEYHFNGKAIIFNTSIGTNSIRYRIGEKVKVLSLNKGPEYVRLNSILWWTFPAVFFGIGLILVAAYILGSESYQAKTFTIFVFLTVLLVAYFRLKSKNLIERLVDTALQVKIEDIESMKGREIFFNESDIEQETQKYSKISLIITSVFLFASSYGVHHFYQSMTERSLDYLFSLMERPENLAIINSYTNDKSMLLFLICSFFTLVLSYSAIYQYKKS